MDRNRETKKPLLTKVRVTHDTIDQQKKPLLPKVRVISLLTYRFQGKALIVSKLICFFKENHSLFKRILNILGRF